MKTVNIFLALILTMSFSAAYGQIPESVVSISDKKFSEYYLDTSNIPQVTGKILNLSPDEYKEVSFEYFTIDAFGEPWNLKSAKLKPDGSFKLDINKAFPYQQVLLKINQLNKPGIIVNSDLHIEIDANILKSGSKEKAYKLSGTDAEINIYLKQHYQYKKSVQDSLISELKELYPIKESNKDVFLQKFDDTFFQLLEIDNNFYEEFPSPYQWVIQNERESLYFVILLKKFFKADIPSKTFEKIKSHKVYVTSEKGILFYKYLTTYLALQDSRPYPKETLLMEQQNFSYISYFINLLDSLFDTPQSDYQKLNLYEMHKDNEQKLEIVKKNLQTEWCRRIAQEEYDKLITRKDSLDKILDKASALPVSSSFETPLKQLLNGARLYNVDSISAEALIQNLKNTFQGKAIFIDIWATWCGPCHRAISDMKQLKGKTKDLPIEYVYLCTSLNSTDATWQRKIAQLDLSGTHLYVDYKIVNDLMKLFSLNGYPSYIFMDTNGNLIEENLHSLKGLKSSEINSLIQ